jgi:streptogramin lyase
MKRAAAGIALSLLLGLAAGADVRSERGRLDREAREAYGRKDYAGFLQAARELLDLTPGSPRALYNLACAQALTGAAAEAIASLDRVAGMGVILDAAKDDDFATLRGTPGFEAVLAKMTALESPISPGRVAFTLPEKDLITEGIAHDPKSGDFFVSSVHRRKVLRVRPDGRVSEFVTEGQDGLLSAVALAVDERRRSLYVSSAGQPMTKGMRPEEKGRSFVVEYGIEDGKERRRLAPPAGLADAFVSDLGLGADGTLAVSDPQSGRVYVLRPGETSLRVLVASGPLVSPQGLAFSPDGRRLFVADYALGIARVDPRSGAVALLPGPESAALGGIDGLVYARGSLIGIQNGFRPHKVLRLTLADDASRITGARVLERARPDYDEPTLGTLAGDDLFYVATSQYSKVREDGSLDLERLKPSIILRLTLD